ncbi:MAG: Phosphatidylglycerophosphatase B-like protein [Berkelbacteria bacterium GW2011_GWB1_38_5]|uniref:Phosphatidylglycerophosphatase B-like protein n=2 Tax=Candidatus Berkelbacteria TaxID=1618330 RepID=A0A0G0LH03_9BACT|nr:MAG: Phosphatidylglycerophosphatase B-like protein [Berkelbacteria bacterium GW2011_GWB1_38_5]KKQ90357.1 MAG: Phosphatidylglycerophosphatase B-like protein [Berkelbacteria bacterium GW2011_GWA1_39_10]
MLLKLLSIDDSVLLSINYFANSSVALQKIFIVTGVYLIYSVPIILVILWFFQEETKKIVLRATLSGIVAWMGVAAILGKMINRPRPFESVPVQELFFHRPDYSFPSDHASFLFAIAFSLWFSGYKKIATIALIIAVIISVSRVAIGVHYPSDIIGGALIGFIIAWLIKVLDKPLDYFYNFVIGLARKIRLA